jgi:hypothetical protein
MYMSFLGYILFTIFRWRLQQELSSLHVLIEVLDAQMKLSEEYEFLLLMKILVGKGSC